MRRWNNFFLPAFLGIALITTGCFSSVSGNAKIADASYTMKLVKGKTTEQEAIALLGQPTSLSDLPDGGQSIAYSYSKTDSSYFVYYASAHTFVKTLTLTFNKKGILTGKSWSQNESGAAG